MSVLAGLLVSHRSRFLDRWCDRLETGPAASVVGRDWAGLVHDELVALLHRGGEAGPLDWSSRQDLRSTIAALGLLQGLVIELAEEEGAPVPISEWRVLARWVGEQIAAAAKELDARRETAVLEEIRSTSR